MRAVRRGFTTAAQIGSVLYPGRERRRALVMLTFYVDDGGKDVSKHGRGGTEVLAAAGYVASEKAWTALEPEWDAIFKGTILHTTDLINGKEDFADINVPTRRSMLSLATNAVNRATLYGVGRHIPVRLFHATPGIKRMIVDGTPLPRALGFAFCVYACLNHLALEWRARPQNEKIAVVLASGTEGLAQTIGFVDWLLNNTRWGAIFQGVAPASNALVGLQAADIIANRTYAMALKGVKGVNISVSPKSLDKWTRRVAQHRDISIAGPTTAKQLTEMVASWEKWQATSAGGRKL
jgi:hypothetical protein